MIKQLLVPTSATPASTNLLKMNAAPIATIPSAAMIVGTTNLLAANTTVLV